MTACHCKGLFKKFLINKIFNIVIVILALRGLQDVYYAFAFSNYSPAFEKFSVFVVYSSALCGLIYILVVQRKFFINDLVLCVMPLIYWILLIMHTNNGYRGDWMTELAAIISFCLLCKETKSLVFKWFYWLVQIQNIFAVFMYMCLLLNIDIGMTKVSYYVGKICYYYKWGILAVFSGSMDRLCGVFNEPGGLGTVCALLFIVTFKYNSIWEKMLLLVTIFFTFSFAGYLLVMVYFVLYIIKKNWINFCFFIPVIMLFLAIPNIDWGNDNLNELAARFEITEDGLAGDNRTTSVFERFYENFKKSGRLFWGYGIEYSFRTSVASYKTIIVRLGLIGFILIVLSWIMGGTLVAKKDKDCILLLLLFLLNMYQRPYLLSNMYGYVVLLGGMEWIHEKKGDIKIG